MPAKLLFLVQAGYVLFQNSYTGGPLADRNSLNFRSPNLKQTMKVSHSEFHCVTVWNDLLLRHYYFLPNPSSLFQTTDRTVR